ncbi:MAG: DNA repair protein RecO C-terminal domain-containing protein, partial [Acidobacteriota bacterium]
TVAALLDGVPATLAARYVEIWILRLAGVFPTPRDCPLCDRPLTTDARIIDDGALICSACAREHGYNTAPAVSGDGLELLRRTAREDVRQLAEQPPRRGVLGEIEGVCARVRRAFLQDELKSYDVMRRILAECAE